VDVRTDVWSLGVVLYEMVCDVRPFAGRSPAALLTAILRASPTPPSTVVPGCSGELSHVIERCLEKDCSKRWSSSAELAERLDGAIPPRGAAGTGCAKKKTRTFLERIGTAAALCGLLLVATPAWGGPPPTLDRDPHAAARTREELPAARARADTASTSRLDRWQMEEFLRRGRIGDLERLSTGVTGSSRALVTWQGLSHHAHVQTVDGYLAGGSRVRNLSDRYHYNVAAYRLDKMLDLNMVPVSVERTVRGESAAVTWWVDDVEMRELERQRLGRQPTDVRSWNDQMYRAIVFQELISNSDFNQTNVLITKDWQVWLIDFTRAFRGYRKLMDPDRPKRIDPRLRHALERLAEESLAAEMKGLLTRSQIRGILARRDQVLEIFAQDGSRRASGLAVSSLPPSSMRDRPTGHPRLDLPLPPGRPLLRENQVSGIVPISRLREGRSGRATHRRRRVRRSRRSTAALSSMEVRT